MKDRSQLIQEDYFGTPNWPWKVLVICQCLNMATWPVVEAVAKELFESYPDPYACDEVCLDRESASYREFYNMVRILGFGHKRVKFIVEMSRMYVKAMELYGESYGRYRVEEYPGCGQYAQDAWKVMVLKQSCDPKDKHIRRYAKKVGLLSGEVEIPDDITTKDG